MLEKGKNKNLKPTAEHRKDNVHFLDFSARAAKPQKQKQEKNFEDLAKKLESRLNKIETNIKEGIKILDEDIHKLLKGETGGEFSAALKEDVNTLARIFEERLRRSLQTAIDTSVGRPDKEDVAAAKNLSPELAKILSFDFFKDVLARLKPLEGGDVDEFGMDATFVQKIKPLFDFLYYKYWRIETSGINNIPNAGRALIVANHSGTLPYDGAMLATAVLNEHPVRKDARFLVEDFVYHMPMLGTFMYRIGGIRACQENAERLLERDHLVMVFPEGVKGIGKYYAERYKLQRFGRGGFIKLCMRTRSPLIPVGIVGAEEIHPIIFKSNIMAKSIGVPYLPITPTFPLLGPLGFIPFPSKWYIHFGTPVDCEQNSSKALQDELLIHKLSETVRNEIQNILIDLLKKRRSIWTG